MKPTCIIFCVAALLVLVGCGDDNGGSGTTTAADVGQTSSTTPDADQVGDTAFFAPDQFIRQVVAAPEALIVSIEPKDEERTEIWRVPFVGEPEKLGEVPARELVLVWSGEFAFVGAVRESGSPTRVETPIWRVALDGTVTEAWSADGAWRCGVFTAYGQTVVTATNEPNLLTVERRTDDGAETDQAMAHGCPVGFFAHVDGTLVFLVEDFGLQDAWRLRVGEEGSLIGEKFPTELPGELIEDGRLVLPRKDDATEQLVWLAVDLDSGETEDLFAVPDDGEELRAFKPYKDGFVGFFGTLAEGRVIGSDGTTTVLSGVKIPTTNPNAIAISDGVLYYLDRSTVRVETVELP